MALRETTDRQVNDLLSDFIPKGGLVNVLPDIKEVRDQSLYILRDGSGHYILYIVTDGKFRKITQLDTGGVPPHTHDDRYYTEAEVNSLLSGKQNSDAQLTDLAGLSYAGNSLKVIRVNAGETAFELATVSGGSVPTSWGKYF